MIEPHRGQEAQMNQSREFWVISTELNSPGNLYSSINTEFSLMLLYVHKDHKDY